MRALLLFLLWTLSSAYKSGDLVRMSKRSLVRMVPTPFTETTKSGSEWTEVIAKHCPRFQYDKTVTLPLIDTQTSSTKANTRDFRVSFSFDHDKFITPYFTIVDGKGTFLESLVFTFVVRGDDIVDINWKTHYNTQDRRDVELRPPTTLSLRFEWQGYQEVDHSLGMGVLLAGSFGTALLTFVYVMLHSEARE